MTTKTNLPIELQNEVIEEFRKQSFCFTEYGNKRILHTNRDVTPEVEKFIIESLQKAYSNGYERGKSEIEPFKSFLLNEGYSEEAINLIGYIDLSKETNEK